MSTNVIELMNEVKNIKGCVFAHVEYIADEKIPKKWGINGKVTKLVSGQVQLNYDYENAVNNRLEKLGKERTFTAKSLPWGVWETPNKIIEHKGDYYLRYYCFKGGKMESVYFVDGRPALQSEINIINEWKKSKKTGSATQSAEGLDENQVEPRCVKFANITYMKCGNLIYQIGKLAV